jgi:hypothetical protein
MPALAGEARQIGGLYRWFLSMTANSENPVGNSGMN